MDKLGLDKILAEFDNGSQPPPQEIQISAATRENWVRFKLEPKRFQPSIFEGDWAFTQQHPLEGTARLLRVIRGSDGISRLIVRQNRFLYAYPWLK